eukprot:g2317.t1
MSFVTPPLPNSLSSNFNHLQTGGEIQSLEDFQSNESDTASTSSYYGQTVSVPRVEIISVENRVHDQSNDNTKVKKLENSKNNNDDDVNKTVGYYPGQRRRAPTLESCLSTETNADVVTLSITDDTRIDRNQKKQSITSITTTTMKKKDKDRSNMATDRAFHRKNQETIHRACQFDMSVWKEEFLAREREVLKKIKRIQVIPSLLLALTFLCFIGAGIFQGFCQDCAINGKSRIVTHQGGGDENVVVTYRNDNHFTVSYRLLGAILACTGAFFCICALYSAFIGGAKVYHLIWSIRAESEKIQDIEKDGRTALCFFEYGCGLARGSLRKHIGAKKKIPY